MVFSGIATVLAAEASSAPLTAAIEAADEIVVPKGATIVVNPSRESSAGLFAKSRIENHGTIICAGTLTLRAEEIVNSGLIVSEYGDVDILSQGSPRLSIDNTHGVLRARFGAINIGDAKSAHRLDVQLAGGDWLSARLNLNCGDGKVEARVGQVTGALNVTAEEAGFTVSTPDLSIGDTAVSGDPTYFNSGNITISGNIHVSEDLAIIASGNITGTAGLASIIVQDAARQGHAVVIVAGANLAPGTPGSTTAIPGSTATAPVVLEPFAAPGGNIDFSACPNLIISTASTNLTGVVGGLAGGSITLLAFASGTNGGKIALPTNSIVDASGGAGVGVAGGRGGKINFIAAATHGVSIMLGSLVTDGGDGLVSTNSNPSNGGDAGAIDLLAAEQVPSVPAAFATNGSITSASDLLTVAITQAGISVAGNMTAHGGTGGPGYLNLSASAQTSAGSGGDGGTLEITSGGQITVGGSIDTDGGAGGGGASGFSAAAGQAGPNGAAGLPGFPGFGGNGGAGSFGGPGTDGGAGGTDSGGLGGSGGSGGNGGSGGDGVGAGANAGDGGQGGGGGNAGAGGVGGIAGAGGLGGGGGTTDIRAYIFTIQGDVVIGGGNGGQGGTGGFGGAGETVVLGVTREWAETAASIPVALALLVVVAALAVTGALVVTAERAAAENPVGPGVLGARPLWRPTAACSQFPGTSWLQAAMVEAVALAGPAGRAEVGPLLEMELRGALGEPASRETAVWAATVVMGDMGPKAARAAPAAAAATAASAAVAASFRLRSPPQRLRPSQEFSRQEESAAPAVPGVSMGRAAWADSLALVAMVGMAAMAFSRVAVPVAMVVSEAMAAAAEIQARAAAAEAVASEAAAARSLPSS